MSADRRFTEAEAGRFFAVSFNQQVWELMEMPERTPHEDELMIYSAHASCRHWLDAGTGVNHQRGEWLIARVYAVLGLAEAALRHAERCLALTHEHAGLMEDFDWAFAHEGIARAHAIAGQREAAREHLRQAEAAGQTIGDQEDRGIFVAELNRGPWNAVR